MNNQPEALRLAGELQDCDLCADVDDLLGMMEEAASELRRLHAENEALKANAQAAPVIVSVPVSSGDTVPLYSQAAPAQPYAPLSDEEIDGIGWPSHPIRQDDAWYRRQYVRAIERAHGIKEKP